MCKLRREYDGSRMISGCHGNIKWQTKDFSLSGWGGRHAQHKVIQHGHSFFLHHCKNRSNQRFIIQFLSGLLHRLVPRLKEKWPGNLEWVLLWQFSALCNWVLLLSCDKVLKFDWYCQLSGRGSNSLNSWKSLLWPGNEAGLLPGCLLCNVVKYYATYRTVGSTYKGIHGMFW